MAEDKLGYKLIKNGSLREESKKLYELEDIKLMTTHQLREICRHEKIINVVIDKMDKEELIRVIMYYRGAVANRYIKKYNPEGWNNIEGELKEALITEYSRDVGNGKLTVYKDRGIHIYDNFSIKYDKRFLGTNAIIVSADKNNCKICGIFNIVAKKNNYEDMYMIKTSEIPCEESPIRNYDIYLMERSSSDLLYDIYQGVKIIHKPKLRVYRIHLLSFKVKNPVKLPLPLVVDFGYNNISLGTYLGSKFFSDHGIAENDASYSYWNPHVANSVKFLDIITGNINSTVLPCAVALISDDGSGQPEFVYGYQAIAAVLQNYASEGLSISLDIKSWLYDPDMEEEFIDREGVRHSIPRKVVLKSFFEYALMIAEDYFKCEIGEIYFTACIKEKKLYSSFFSNLLPQYDIDDNHIICEDIGILYGMVMNFLRHKKIRMKEEYKALLVDCGGSMINAVSSVFSVNNKRMAFDIKIKESYRNGSIDFGGNQMTYRIMQLLKLMICATSVEADQALKDEIEKVLNECKEYNNSDVFRMVDEHGVEYINKDFIEVYDKVERFLPTKFKEWENSSRSEYYRVINNFHNMFFIAEDVKRMLYGLSKGHCITITEKDNIPNSYKVDRWKFNVLVNGKFETISSIPNIELNKYDIYCLLQADIYAALRLFLDESYQSGELDEFSIIKLTGQSCYTDLFRLATSEFVAGKRIQINTTITDKEDLYGKNSGLNGAIRFLYDKFYGYTDVTIDMDYDKIPYDIIAYTHDNQEVQLIKGDSWKDKGKSISRTMDDLTLQLYLRDLSGKIRCSFNYNCQMESFEEKTYDEIAEIYGDIIKQDDVDVIVGRETKFFVWADPIRWGFTLLPISRNHENLQVGPEEFFYFEGSGWTPKLLDGKH